ncbi:hypothetical protein GOODEAATRI_009988, partial [Goodea atripinnis]
PTTFTNVATKRREYVQDQNQGELTSCNQQVKDLQRQVEDQQKSMTLMSQQPTCNPVFKRFLSRLIGILVFIISTVICTQLWSAVSWFVQFRRMFAVCFVVSIIWNWFYLYQHGIMAPFRRPRRDPPAPELEHLQRFHPRIEARDYFAGGDAPAHAPMLANGQQHVSWHQGDNARLDGNNIHRRRPNRVREDSAPVGVETLRAADPLVSEDELDGSRSLGGRTNGPDITEMRRDCWSSCSGDGFSSSGIDAFDQSSKFNTHQ